MLKNIAMKVMSDFFVFYNQIQEGNVIITNLCGSPILFDKKNDTVSGDCYWETNTLVSSDGISKLTIYFFYNPTINLLSIKITVNNLSENMEYELIKNF